MCIKGSVKQRGGMGGEFMNILITNGLAAAIPWGEPCKA